MQSSTTERTFSAHKGMSRAILSPHHKSRGSLCGASRKVASTAATGTATTLDSTSLTVYGDEGGRVFASLSGAGFALSDLAEAANQLATLPTTGRTPQKLRARVEVGKVCSF